MVFVLFIAALIACVVLNLSVVYALALGLALFFTAACLRGNTVIDVVKMAVNGAMRAKNMVQMFVLIGIITGVWRACGTIPWIVTTSAAFISPRSFVLSAFLLSSIMSILTGTSFGTVSTMGVVMMIIAAASGANPLMTAGAVLSGAYVGDRASPMSSCARINCDCSKTDYYDNIANWVKTAAVPVVLAAAAYYIFCPSPAKTESGLTALDGLRSAFVMHWTLALPAVLILLLSFFKVNVKLNMALSALVGAVLAVTVQGMTLPDLLRTAIFGFTLPGGGQTAAMMDGGGITSMLRAAFIVLFSSAYIGIFEKTGMLAGAEKWTDRLSHKLGLYPVTLLIGTAASAVSCNQTLAMLLTSQLCGKNYADGHEFASDLANSTCVVAGLIPWSIACAIPLSVMGVGSGALLFSFYLWLTPICHFVWRLLRPARLAENNETAPV